MDCARHGKITNQCHAVSDVTWHLLCAVVLTRNEPGDISASTYWTPINHGYGCFDYLVAIKVTYQTTIEKLPLDHPGVGLFADRFI
jgi:hypothetical protein